MFLTCWRDAQKDGRDGGTKHVSTNSLTHIQNHHSDSSVPQPHQELPLLHPSNEPLCKLCRCELFIRAVLGQQFLDEIWGTLKVLPQIGNWTTSGWFDRSYLWSARSCRYDCEAVVPNEFQAVISPSGQMGNCQTCIGTSAHVCVCIQVGKYVEYAFTHTSEDVWQAQALQFLHDNLPTMYGTHEDYVDLRVAISMSELHLNDVCHHDPILIILHPRLDASARAT